MPNNMTRRTLLAGGASATQAARAHPVRLPRKVRVALLGLEGHTGEILNPLGRVPDVELVAVSDRDREALDHFSRRRGMSGVHRYSDYKRLLGTERVDVAGVCVPNGPRARVVLECLNRGLHVVAEKPLALSRRELDAIRSARQRYGVGLSMLLPMRYASPYRALRQIVASGEIGEVCQVASQKSYKIGRRPEWMRNRSTYGGTIPWIGIHMIDLMRWTSGREFRDVYSRTAHIGFPEIGDMENVTASVFSLDNQGLAVLRMDYLRPPTADSHGDDRLRLAGTKGVAEYEARTGVRVVSTGSPPRRISELPPAGSVFIDFLRSLYLGAEPTLTVADICRVNEITIAAQQAAERRARLDCG